MRLRHAGYVWQVEDQKGTSMKADELLEILKEDKDAKRDEAQSGVVSDKARPSVSSLDSDQMEEKCRLDDRTSARDERRGCLAIATPCCSNTTIAWPRGTT